MELDRFIRLPELLKITGASKTTLYRWISEGHFPKPVREGPNMTAWRASLIQKWIESREEVPWPTSPSQNEQQDGEVGGDASPREAAP